MCNTGTKFNDISEVCHPKCTPGQCCMRGACFCFNAVTKKADNCGLFEFILD